MDDSKHDTLRLMVHKAPLPWLWGGLLLGLVQILAIWINQPLGVSTQFVVADTQVLEALEPAYVADHPLIGNDKYMNLGYGWWLNIGLIFGAFIAALATRRWRLQASTVWWACNRGHDVKGRLLICFIGGILILLGARFAHGCTSGQFASGWAQLSLSAVPFTIAMFAAAMITARLVYPKSPHIEK